MNESARDYFEEAWAILEHRSRLLPERAHLEALRQWGRQQGTPARAGHVLEESGQYGGI